MNLKKRLIPKFLLRLDKHLLLHLPFVWRTHIHFLLFYSLLAGLVLFGIGLLYPMDLCKLHQNAPQIKRNQGYIFMVMILSSFLILIYWWNQLSKYKTPIVNSKNILLEWFIYFVSVSVIMLNSFMWTWGIESKKAYLTTQGIDYNDTFLTEHQHFQLGYITHYDPHKTKDKATYFRNGENLLAHIQTHIVGEKANKAFDKLILDTTYSHFDGHNDFKEYFSIYTLADSSRLLKQIENTCTNEQKSKQNKKISFDKIEALYGTGSLANQLSNQMGVYYNQKLINNLDDDCAVKSKLASFMRSQQKKHYNWLKNMWSREEFITSLDTKEKEAYKKAIRVLDNYPVAWYHPNDEEISYRNGTLQSESIDENREALWHWETKLLTRLIDSIDLLKLKDFADKNKIEFDSFDLIISNYDIPKSPESKGIFNIYKKWLNNLYRDSIDKTNPKVKPLGEVFRQLVAQFDTLSFNKYLVYAQLDIPHTIEEIDDTMMRSKQVDVLVAQSNKNYDYLRQSEKDSLLLFMNLKRAAAVELFNRLWTKEYSDYVLQKYPLSILEQLNDYHVANGFPRIEASDTTVKKKKILLNNEEFIAALERVEKTKAHFGEFIPIGFLFCVFGVNITFLLFFLSITSRGVIVTSLFISTLLLSCIFLLSSISNQKEYIEVFILGSFALSGIILNLLLFFAKSKIRFIEYYIINSIFMGIVGMVWFNMDNLLSSASREIFSQYETEAQVLYFYFFMLVLISFTLLYKRHLNLPNKK